MLAGDDQRVREGDDVLSGNPVVHLDGAGHLDIVRHVDEQAVGQGRLMQGGELGGAQTRFLLHEMFLHQVAMRDERLGEGQADDAFRQAGGIRADQLIVHEHQLRSRCFQSGGFRHQLRGLHLSGAFEAGEVELLEVRETPWLVTALRGGGGEVAFPGRLLAVGEPCGE